MIFYAYNNKLEYDDWCIFQENTCFFNKFNSWTIISMTGHLYNIYQKSIFIHASSGLVFNSKVQMILLNSENLSYSNIYPAQYMWR